MNSMLTALYLDAQRADRNRRARSRRIDPATLAELRHSRSSRRWF